jgi:hypothetical protein
MAPRTKDQQEAYNAKRRAEAAAKKQPAKAAPVKAKAKKVMETKIEGDTVRRVERGVVHAKPTESFAERMKRAKAEKASKIVGEPRKSSAEINAEAMVEVEKEIKERVATEKAVAKQDRLLAESNKRNASVKAANAERKVIGSARTKPLDPEEEVEGKLIINDDDDEVVSLPNKPATVVQTGAVQQHSMAKSYVRKAGAGKGKLRGKTYQATVSFTREQMDQIIAAAGFRNVSLAEMIRSCVAEHLNKSAASPS